MIVSMLRLTMPWKKTTIATLCRKMLARSPTIH